MTDCNNFYYEVMVRDDNHLLRGAMKQIGQALADGCLATARLKEKATVEDAISKRSPSCTKKWKGYERNFNPLSLPNKIWSNV